VLYVNQVGGQDELVFDGGSMAIGRDGTLAVLAPHFAQGLYPVRIARDARATSGSLPGAVAPEPNLHATVYAALVPVCATMCDKNRFKGVVLGLSGGIDSALTLAIAVDALGAAARGGGDDAVSLHRGDEHRGCPAQAARSACAIKVIPIEPMFDAFMGALDEEFAGRAPTPPRRTSRRAAAACC
jgi:NAD+ synthase (glutamine-hydrolysing)